MMRSARTDADPGDALQQPGHPDAAPEGVAGRPLDDRGCRQVTRLQGTAQAGSLAAAPPAPRPGRPRAARPTGPARSCATAPAISAAIASAAARTSAAPVIGRPIDEQVGPVGDGPGGRGDAPLVVEGRSRRAHARGDQRDVPGRRRHGWRRPPAASRRSPARRRRRRAGPAARPPPRADRRARWRPATSASSEVSTVTAVIRVPGRASTAAATISAPPEACTVR